MEQPQRRSQTDIHPKCHTVECDFLRVNRQGTGNPGTDVQWNFDQ